MAEDMLLQQGIALHQAGRLPEAEALYRQVLLQEPQNPEALHLYGVLAYQAKKPSVALDFIGRAIRLRGDQANYYSNAALVLGDLGRTEEAEAACRTALQLQPGSLEALNNLGLVLRAAGKLDEAVATLRTLLQRQPGSVQALNNLGTTLLQLRRHEDAAAVLGEALRLGDDGPHRHSIAYNQAQTLLALGRFEAGWRLYESRPPLTAPRRAFEAPLWDGQPVGTLLLHAEQGLGDTLQFCRFAPLAAPGATIVLEVQPPLKRLLATLPGIAEIVAQGEALPPHDAQYPLMSLPYRLGTILETIPVAIPYLRSDPAAAEAWRSRLAALGGAARIGLVWAGAPYRPETPGLVAMDRRRSLDLAQLAPLGAIPGAVFVSLQKGVARSQAPAGLAFHDFTDELADFADTAALVEALDLVISVDTSVVHLAGALGKPVWVLDRFDSCWRWLTGRTDSPWYPTLRLFRQPTAGDWASVIAEVQDALAAWMRSMRTAPALTRTKEN